jgi:hypothetical protein
MMTRSLEFIPYVPFIETDGRLSTLGNGCWRNVSWGVIYDGEIDKAGSYLDGSFG